MTRDSKFLCDAIRNVADTPFPLVRDGLTNCLCKKLFTLRLEGSGGRNWNECVVDIPTLIKTIYRSDT